MQRDLSGVRVGFLVAQEGVEERELTDPWRAIERAGGNPELIAPEEGAVLAFNHLKPGNSLTVTRSLDQADPSDYDALVLPGGLANPDQLRTDARAVSFVQTIFDEGKPVGVICHGAWTLIEADVLYGRRLTSWPSLQTDIRNAGGEWLDAAVVLDDGLISGRGPDDLPAFCAAIIDQFSNRAGHGQQAAYNHSGSHSR